MQEVSCEGEGEKQVKGYFTTRSVLRKFVNATCVALHWCK